MKVLMLNPSPGNRTWYRAEHLGIAYLAAVLRQTGHEVHLLDSFLEDLDVDQTYQTIKSRFEQIDMLGVTATEPETIRAGMAVVKKLRGDGFAAHVTAGGYLPTFWSEELLPRVSRGGLRGRGGGRRDPEGAGAGAGGGQQPGGRGGAGLPRQGWADGA